MSKSVPIFSLTMLRLALLLIVPCLIAAETTCPGGELSCPEGQTCCTVNNKQSCCDEAQLPIRSDLLAAASNSSVQNGPYDGCTIFTCDGTCCNTGYYGCCPFKGASCCANNRCCQMLNTCCGDGCCPYNTKCCSGGWCCKRNQRCGLSWMTCYAGAGALSPTTLVTLVAAWVVAYAIKKL